MSDETWLCLPTTARVVAVEAASPPTRPRPPTPCSSPSPCLTAAAAAAVTPTSSPSSSPQAVNLTREKINCPSSRNCCAFRRLVPRNKNIKRHNSVNVVFTAIQPCQ
ncbi:uncharacterized protein LOC124144938 [Haliotis rufescens]|uniref:uncharacterized protein LOC124144938 n=1 Tax=Haliotis rufescens TaxID=6454 RepID=UPI00201FA386|nr:uncharacterized protein LOC124144938 [Haliotis rufescens]